MQELSLNTIELLWHNPCDILYISNQVLRQVNADGISNDKPKIHHHHDKMKSKLTSRLMSIPIKHLVSLILLVLLVPSITLIIHSGIQERNNEKKHIKARLMQLAEFTANNQKEAAIASEDLAHLLSHLPEVSNRDIPAIRTALSGIMKTNHQIENIFIADSSGKVIAATTSLSTPVSIANHRCFKNARSTKKPASGEYYASMRTRNSAICFGFPLLSKKGEFDGLVLIEYGANLFKITLDKAIYPPDCNISLFDHNGTRIYSHLFPQHVGQSIRPENFKMMRMGNEDGAFFESQDSSGNGRLFYFRKLRLKSEQEPYLYIRVGLPADAVHADLNRRFLLEIMALASITILSFGFAWLLSKHLIINRIMRLNTAVQSLAGDNLDINIPDIEGAELGQLAQSFNRMIEHLRSRESFRLMYEEELRFNESKFKSLYKLSFMADNPESAIESFALGEAIRLTGSTSGHICELNLDESVLAVRTCSGEGACECRTAVEYGVADAGLWGESVRQRKPVIINGHGDSNPQSGALPHGFGEISRYLSVPLIVDNKVVMLVGVGNKDMDYSEKDVLMLTLIMDGIWRIKDKKRTVEERLENERILDTLLNAVLESIGLVTTDYMVVKANRIFAKRLNCTPDEMYGKCIFNFFTADVRDSRRIRYRRALATRQPVMFEDRRGNITFINAISPVLDASGNVIYLAVYAMDISRLKNYENELIAANEILTAQYQKIEVTREEERRNIARELHDQMGQILTAMNMDLSWLIRQMKPEMVHRFNSHINGMRLNLANLISMVQNITSRLTPPLLENLGLAAAIGHYVQDFQLKSGIVCHLMLDEDAGNLFDKEDSIAIFRILQEALTNVVRHANACEVAISLCLTPQSVVLEVADNGNGITSREIRAPDSFGMLGMQERAKKCGGSLAIHGVPGDGTVVRVVIPR